MGDDGREGDTVAQNDQRERLALSGLHVSNAALVTVWNG